MNVKELKKDEVRKYFPNTFKIIESNPFIKIDGDFGNESYSSLTSIVYNKQGKTMMDIFNGTVKSVFSDITAQEDYVYFPISTYSGHRNLMEMEEQVDDIKQAIKVLKKLEEVYNKERIKYREYFKEDSEDKTKSISDREVYEKELKVSKTKGDTKIFEVNGKNPHEVFYNYLQYAIRGIRRNLGDKETIFSQKINIEKGVYVSGNPAVVIRSRGKYAIKANEHGFDLCTKDGKGIKEIFRKGNDKVEDIGRLLIKVFPNEDKSELKWLARALEFVYNGQVGRSIKKEIVDNMK